MYLQDITFLDPSLCYNLFYFCFCYCRYFQHSLILITTFLFYAWDMLCLHELCLGLCSVNINIPYPLYFCPDTKMFISSIACTSSGITLYLTENTTDSSIKKNRINVHKSSCKLSYFYRTWNKFRMCRQIVERIQNMKFYRNPSNGCRAVPCEQTDTW